MNIRRVVQEEIAQVDDESLVVSIPKTLFMYLLAGIGLGVGFFLVRKIGMR